MADPNPPSTATAATPSPEDRKLLEALVADCIEAIERGERDAAVRVCAARPELLTHVQRRLSQLAQRGLIPATASPQPMSIGPYRIRAELGSGGMGAVYLAEQTEPVRRDVALKVIKLGMDTREVVARFEAERQALARMNHPHIAQVFDAGITLDGRPYFVMEYVAGQTLTTFCDERSFSPEQRIRLLATVCRAVQHAHDRGFIHRDLKPSNVLVVEHEGQFAPKVIDFGIAKATAPDSTGAAHTRADQVLGTPEYMSPEQALSGGLDVDTRSDVYSLGAILYELLCGELPFDSLRLRRVGRHELARILQDELPTTPSRRLSLVGADVVAARGGERTTVQRRVTGELDWITLKALGKQREQRYPSALAFAEDLERWLRHEPVLAAPPGAGYRLRKFARRHRVALLAASAVFVSLVLGLVASLTAAAQARRAEQRATLALDDVRAFYGLARDAIGGLVGVADQELVDVPQAEPVRRQMLAEAIRYYRALQARQPTDPALRIDLLVATERIGVLQRRLGQPAEAMATLQKCVADAALLQKDLPDERRVLQLAIQAGNSLARALSAAGRGDEAKVALRTALATLAHARTLPDAPELDGVEANLLANLAIESDDDTALAVELFTKATAANARAAARSPDDLGRQRSWVRCQGLLAAALTRQDRLDEAATELAAATARLQTLGAVAGASMRETEAMVQDQFAQVLRRLGRHDEAAAAQQRSIARLEQLAAEHPDVPAHRDQIAAAWHFLAQLAEDEAQLPRAIECIGEAIAVREQLAQQYAQDHRQRMRYARSLATRAAFEVALWQAHGGNVDDAQATLVRAAAVTNELLEQHGDDVEVVLTFAGVHAAFAALHEARSQPSEALQEHLAVRTVLQEQLARTPSHTEVHYQLASVHNNLALCYQRSGEWHEAIGAGEAALDHLQQGLALDARHRGLLDLATQLFVRLAAAQAGSGDDAAGLAILRQMIRLPGLAADTRETGAMTFAQHVASKHDLPQRAALLVEAETHVRAVLQQRAPLAQALERPAQQSAAAHHASLLRDLDLRIVLADLFGERQDLPAQATVLDEALQFVAVLPDLGVERLRDLYGQSMQNLLHRGEVDAAAARAEQLVARGPADATANQLAAAAFAACFAKAPPGERREHFASRAVACLQIALRTGKLTSQALDDPQLSPLRGRTEFEALRTK